MSRQVFTDLLLNRIFQYGTNRTGFEKIWAFMLKNYIEVKLFMMICRG
jgi:hypothetical protein